MSRRRLGALFAAALAIAALVAPAGAAPASRDRGGTSHPRHRQAGPRILARSWALIDARDGEILTSHAGNERRLIASTTKLMTAYVALHDLPLGKVVRARPYAYEYGESVMGLRAGQRISVRDLLYGLILLSAGDAANTLAIESAGSVKKFVVQMNRHAAALGLTNTHYANPVGLDQKGNYSSALDLAALTMELERIPIFAKIADSRRALLRSLRPPRRIESINALLGMAPWVTGVKTGHTWKAGYVLVGSGRRHGIPLISVAIDAPTDETRFSDCLELLEWGFRQYHRRAVPRRGQRPASAAIRYTGGELPLRVGHSLTVRMRRGQRVALDVHAPVEVTGPIRRGARLGSATVLVDGRPAGRVPLLASRRIPAAGAFDRARAFVRGHLIALAVALCAILIVAMLLGRPVRRIRRGKRVQQK